MTDRPADKDDAQQVNDSDRPGGDAQKVDEAEPPVSAETTSASADVQRTRRHQPQLRPTRRRPTCTSTFRASGNSRSLPCARRSSSPR